MKPQSGHLPVGTLCLNVGIVWYVVGEDEMICLANDYNTNDYNRDINYVNYASTNQERAA